MSMGYTSKGHTSIKLKKIQILDWTDLCAKRELPLYTKAKFRSKADLIFV
jgi:hypothetical protein